MEGVRSASFIQQEKLMDPIQQPEVEGFTLEEINRAVDALVKAQARASDSVGKVLVMAVYASIVGVTAGQSKDFVGIANTLIKVLRKSTKKDAIVAFLQTYGKLNYSKDAGGVFKHFDLGSAAGLAWTKEYVAVVKLAAASWESFKAEPASVELDVEAKVQAIITAAAKAQKANKPVKNEKLINGLVEALAKYHAATAV